MEPIAMRMSDDLAAALDEEAKAQDRTFSDLSRLILRDEMVRRGRLCATCYGYRCSRHTVPGPVLRKQATRTRAKPDAVPAN